MPMYDASVLPSFLEFESVGDYAGSNQFNSMTLMEGEVIEIIYPEDKSSLSKKVIEYNVDVVYRRGSSPSTTVTYPNCIVQNLFGGIADFSHYTLRARDKDPQPGSVSSNGSRVLILCMNGESRRGVIVGGLDNLPLDKNGRLTQTKKEGHCLKQEFNGVNFDINKDGEAKVTFNGPTKWNGEPVESEGPSGTFVQLDKEGSFKIATVADDTEDQYVYINHKDKKIQILANDEWSVEVKGDLTFQVGNNISIQGDGKMDIEVKQNIKMNSSGVHVGSATDAWVKGTSYRNAESQMLKTLASNFQALQIAFVAIAKKLAVPVSGAVASVPEFETAAQLVGAMKSAIDSFEGGSANYLSKKNKTD